MQHNAAYVAFDAARLARRYEARAELGSLFYDAADVERWLAKMAFDKQEGRGRSHFLPVGISRLTDRDVPTAVHVDGLAGGVTPLGSA